MHATEARKIMVQGKDLFSAGNNTPSPLLINLTKSIFFLLFLPKYTEWILGKKKKSPHAHLSFHHRVFNTITKPICHRFCFQKEKSILSCPILSLYYYPLQTGHGRWLSYQSIEIKLYPFISVLLQPVQRCCEKESELKSSFLRKDGQWNQTQKHLKNSSPFPSAMISLKIMSHTHLLKCPTFA